MYLFTAIICISCPTAEGLGYRNFNIWLVTLQFFVSWTLGLGRRVLGLWVLDSFGDTNHVFWVLYFSYNNISWLVSVYSYSQISVSNLGCSWLEFVSYLIPWISWYSRLPSISVSCLISVAVISSCFILVIVFLCVLCDVLLPLSQVLD